MLTSIALERSTAYHRETTSHHLPSYTSIQLRKLHLLALIAKCWSLRAPRKFRRHLSLVSAGTLLQASCSAFEAVKARLFFQWCLGRGWPARPFSQNHCIARSPCAPQSLGFPLSLCSAYLNWPGWILPTSPQWSPSSAIPQVLPSLGLSWLFRELGVWMLRNHLQLCYYAFCPFPEMLRHFFWPMMAVQIT